MAHLQRRGRHHAGYTLRFWFRPPRRARHVKGTAQGFVPPF